MGVLTDLQNRGAKDILIACVDNLTGFAEAINSVFPKTEIQTCVVYQIRNSLKYVASKDQKAFMADLKPVYQADTLGWLSCVWMNWRLNGAVNMRWSSSPGGTIGIR